MAFIRLHYMLGSISLFILLTTVDKSHAQVYTYNRLIRNVQISSHEGRTLRNVNNAQVCAMHCFMMAECKIFTYKGGHGSVCKLFTKPADHYQAEFDPDGNLYGMKEKDEGTSSTISAINVKKKMASIDEEVGCKNTVDGRDYQGKKNVTDMGIPCQKWNSNTPHKIGYYGLNNSNFSDENLDAAENYCRNLNGEPLPWCHTTNPFVLYAFCDIPLCNSSSSKTAINTNNSKECRKSRHGLEYDGTLSTTVSGYTCQHWKLDTPHKKDEKASNPQNFPERDLKAAKNYCRNPDNKPRPWCYTTDPLKEYDVCDIPMCKQRSNNN